MNICIPIDEDHGIHSRVCAHFGSASAFMIVDADTGACRTVHNHNQHHEHGRCMPLASLQGESIDAFVVGGIGAGALSKLLAGGFTVYLAQRPTVGETIVGLRAGTLREVTPEMACANREHGGR